MKMSDYEYNKGKLIPFGDIDEDRAKSIVGTTPSWADSALEAILESGEDYGLVKINDQWFKVDFEVRRGQMLDEFCSIAKHDNGVIEFASQHYNGGAHWTEVVEKELKK